MGLKNKWIQFKFELFEFYQSYILRKEYCEYCYYFGGLMCDHLDENNNCLGFRRWTIKDRIQSRIRQKKFNKILDQTFKEKYGKDWKTALKNRYNKPPSPKG